MYNLPQFKKQKKTTINTHTVMETNNRTALYCQKNDY